MTRRMTRARLICCGTSNGRRAEQDAPSQPGPPPRTQRGHQQPPLPTSRLRSLHSHCSCRCYCCCYFGCRFGCKFHSCCGSQCCCGLGGLPALRVGPMEVAAGRRRGPGHGAAVDSDPLASACQPPPPCADADAGRAAAAPAPAAVALAPAAGSAPHGAEPPKSPGGKTTPANRMPDARLPGAGAPAKRPAGAAAASVAARSPAAANGRPPSMAANGLGCGALARHLRLSTCTSRGQRWQRRAPLQARLAREAANHWQEGPAAVARLDRARGLERVADLCRRARSLQAVRPNCPEGDRRPSRTAAPSLRPPASRHLPAPATARLAEVEVARAASAAGPSPMRLPPAHRWQFEKTTTTTKATSARILREERTPDPCPAERWRRPRLRLRRLFRRHPADRCVA
mmetsp:Transcript_62568/g.179972  ORF Transcript_62568/g.179972 Transcript_62568/m.179972 type:complete len:401 (-) Transcript_62568:324-1526(-)